MLEKPQMEREVAVVVSHECVRAIYLYSTLDALPDLREFGLITTCDGVPDKYVLWVDGRFNFGKVLNWIEANWKPEQQ